MGLGREVADAYISVHGDLSDFRNDLNKAGPMTEKMAKDNAAKFADIWGSRLESDINGKWNDIVTAMYNNNAVDWDRLFGKFDSTDLDAANEKVLSFMEGMRDSGKLTAKQYKDMQKQVEVATKALQKQHFIEADLAEERKRWNNAHLDMMDGLARARQRDADEESRLQQALIDGEKAAAKIRARIMDEAIAENERWARSFDGITKNANIKALNDDFRKLAESMAKGDMHDFAKTFDEDWLALRTRVMEVTDAMVVQGRISEENRRKIHDAIDDHIKMEETLRQATARTTSEVAYAKIAQDRYNKSLEGMIESSRVKRLETDFRNLSDAIDSGNWDRIARGHKDIDSMRISLAGTVNEMRRLGRISDGAFSSVMNTIGGINVDFKKATSSSKEMGFSLGKNNALLSVMGKGVENVVGKIKGLAGFNVVGDVFREGGEFIQNLDRNAVKIAKIATAAGGLISVIGSSAGGIATIANDIAKAAGGLAILAPGFLTGAGIGIGVLVASFKDMKTVLADLGPQFNKLQDVISEKFWGQAEKPIRNLVDSLMPTLNKQLGNTGTAMGGLVGAFADAFKDTATPERVTVMFERMNAAIDILKKAMAPLTRAFVNLGETGSKYFGRFADWIVKVSEKFDAFIQKSKDNGDLDKWIERGIKGLEDLGSVISSTTRIFGSISDAARAAGSKGLAGFAENMRNIATFMESPRFQKALTGVFDGFYITLNGIEKGVQAVGRGMENFIPTFQRISGSLGQVFETLGIYIEKFLSNKILQDGVEKFFAGINTALNNLSPAIGPMADSLGQLFKLMADVLPNITTIISKIATTWGPSFDKMLEAIKPLIKPVTDLALVFIEKMGPVFDTFVTEVLPPLVDLFIELLPSIELLVSLVTPVLIELLKQMGEFFKTVADGLKEFNREAGPALKSIKDIADAIKTVKLPSDLDLGGLGTGNFAAKIAIAFAKMQPGIAVAVGTALKGLTTSLSNSIKTALDFGGMISDLFNPNKMPKTLANITASVATWAKGVGESFKKGWEDFTGGIKGMFEDIYKKVKEEFQKFMSSLLGFNTSPSGPGSVSGGGAGGRGMGASGKLDPKILGLGEPEGMFEGLIARVQEELGKFFGTIGAGISQFGASMAEGWNSFWGSLGTKVQEVWDGIALWISTKYTEITTGIGTWVADLGLQWTTFWDTLPVKVQEVWDAIILWITTKYTEITTGIATWIADVSMQWTAFWDSVNQKVTDIWNTIVAWIVQKYTEISTNIASFIADVKTNWDNFWTSVNQTVTNIWTTIVSWISGKVGEIRSGIDSFISTVKSNWDNFWATVKQKVTDAWEGIKSGVSNGVTAVVTFFTEMPGKITGAFSDIWGKMSGIGTSIWEGLKAGIEGGLTWVTNAAANLANSAVEAAKRALNINSPSKRFRSLGLSGGEGMAQGFDWSGASVASAAEAMANTAADAVVTVFATSKMYAAGVNAALGLADGISSSKSTVAAAFSDVLPDTTTAAMRISGSSSSGVGGPTPQKIVNIENLSMPITTPTKDPALVASRTIDGFAAATNI